MKNKEMPLISIVIPTFNSMSENKNIERLLLSIFSQTYQDFEVIIVDNFSNDITKEINKRFPVDFVQTNCTISKANNIGLERAKGKYIMFLDSDMELQPSFLEECARLIDSSSFDCILMQFSCAASKKASFLNCVELRNLELDIGAALLNIYCYSAQVIGNTKFPESSKPIVGEEYIFRNLILNKKPTIGLVETKILHYYDPSVRWLIRRAWKYGRWFVETRRHLTIRQTLRFINYNSIVQRGLLKTSIRVIKSKPRLVLHFMLYICIKYMAFMLGYLAGL